MDNAHHPTPFTPVSTLTFRDGHIVELDIERVDADGAYLDIRHTIARAGRLAGPHWHPLLAETFRVDAGQARFRVDRVDTHLGPEEQIHIEPRQVHEFWSTTAGVTLSQRVRPPGRHAEMFSFWHQLDSTGKTTRAGVPRNPLDLATLWALQDGYVAHIPPWLQRVTLGGLARLVKRR